jgi:uncharacterized protein YdhG (YjbR/CyaY superfamily)
MQTQTKREFNKVDKYIASQPEHVRPTLELLRKTIKKAAPKAEELISYRIPAFRFHGMLIWYAAFNNHYGIYGFPKTLEIFKDKLKPYELSKGTIRFPIDKPLPLNLITEIIKYRVNENVKKKFLKEKMNLE